MPTSQQVVPGAAVSIVLKQDQPTGREVQGVVQDLLSRGDHPRGIKVRLKDGRIGRVQRMATGSTAAPLSAAETEHITVASRTPKMRNGERGDQESFLQEPPLRTLGDYRPDLDDPGEAFAQPGEELSFSSATIKCPICGGFEGDEAAVSHHVEEHLE